MQHTGPGLAVSRLLAVKRCLSSTSPSFDSPHARHGYAGVLTIFNSRSFSSSSSSSRSPSAAAATPSAVAKEKKTIHNVRLEDFEPKRIRNFCIIAHVDHGKSTLADRLLELSGNISINGKVKNEQVLDTLKVERERGITVKAQTASMIYYSKSKQDLFLLNLIDTPGHVDFNFEVKRSLQACDGALILVDSSQGIQAQTFANFNAARDAGIEREAMIPVLTKLDLPNANPDAIAPTLQKSFGFEASKILWTSAKSGEGIEDVFEAIVDHIPHPIVSPSSSGECSAMILDSIHSPYKGVVCLVLIKEGELHLGDPLELLVSSTNADKLTVKDLEIVTPAPLKKSSLKMGQVGLVVCGLKEATDANVGNYLLSKGYRSTFKRSRIDFNQSPVAADGSGSDDEQQEQQQQRQLEQQRPKQLVFSSIYPETSNVFDSLDKALKKLSLNDPSVSVRRESSTALGQGFRCGFLGRLHMEVFVQRLEDEFNQSIICTAPSVPYIVRFKSGQSLVVEKPSDLPSNNDQHDAELRHPLGPVLDYLEPRAKVIIVTPLHYLGSILDLLSTEKRGVQQKLDYLTEETILLEFELPLEEVINDLVDKVKTLSSGYASIDYTECGHEEADIVRVDILVSHEKIDSLAFATHRSAALKTSRVVLEKLRSNIGQEQFEVHLQAVVENKVIAKERVRATRKDVLVKAGKVVGGGDRTRKMKLLKKQKEGRWSGG